MATLSDTIKFSEEFLSTYTAEALDGRSDEDFVNEFLSGTNKILSANPRIYRSYGPFWPAVKQLLVEHGHTGFGREIETSVAALYSYERAVLTLIAATLYSQTRLEGGNIYAAEHVLPTREEADDETYTFYSGDDEIERRLT